MPLSDSVERSEQPSEGATLPPITLGRRRLLKGFALGSLLALGGGSVLVLWGRQHIPQYIPFISMGGAAGRITALAWSPDGKYIASATGVIPIDRYDVDPSTATTLQMWEARHGKLLFTYPFSQQGTLSPPLAWSSDSQRFAWWSGTQQELRLYEAKGEAPSPHPLVRTLFHRPNMPAGQLIVAFSPDGKWLASGGEYSGQLSVNRINNDGTPGWRYDPPDDWERNITALAWSPNSLRLVAGRSNASTGIIRSQMIIMDSTSGKPLLQTPETTLETITSLAWSPDGSLIAVGYEQDRENGRGYVKIFIPSHGQQVTSYQPTDTRGIWTICWPPRSSRLLALITNYSSAVQIWDTQTHAVLATYAHGIGVIIDAVAWSPDGRYLVTGGEDKRLCIWQVPTA
jgi:WD40 repeat protein